MWTPFFKWNWKSHKLKINPFIFSDDEVYVQTGGNVVNKLQSKFIHSIEYISEKISGHSNGSNSKYAGKVTGLKHVYYQLVHLAST
jgi:hypothetical protein